MRQQLNLAVFLAALLLTNTAQPAAAGSLKNMGAKVMNRPVAPAVPLIHEKWAVLVGVEEFQDPAIAARRCAEKNVSQLGGVLVDPNAGRFAPDHLVTLKSYEATRAKVAEVITGSWLPKKALPRDLVILYLCSRTIAAANGKELYICAYDTLASEPDNSAIPLKEILTELRHRLQCKYIVCLLDGAPLASAKNANVSLESLSKESGVTILTAAAANQCPGESADGSAFARNLCEAVKSSLGTMTLDAVSKHVIERARQAEAASANHEHPAFYPASDSQEMLTIAIGTPVKSSTPVKKLAIGHPVDNLMATRPDLTVPRSAASAPAAGACDDDDDAGQADSSLDFGSYMTKMKRDIQQKWQPPKGLENRHVLVTFTIERDGKIVAPAVVESSGTPAADQAALEALKAASPLDPLPLGAPRSVQIRYRFEWQVKRQ